MLQCGVRRIRYNNFNNRINRDFVNYIQKNVRSFHIGYPSSIIAENQRKQLYRHSFYSSFSTSSPTDGVVVVDDLPKTTKPEVTTNGGGKNNNNSNSKHENSSSWSPMKSKKKYLRLPFLSGHDEFPTMKPKKKIRRQEKFYVELEATKRKLRMAILKVLEPPTLHFLGLAATATLTVGLIEGTLICKEWPFLATTAESWDATKFVLRYSVEQLFPSVVWMTQDPHLVATALHLDPTQVLRDLSGDTPESASLILQTQLLASSRAFWAGFMMIAQLVRAAAVSIDAFAEYQDRIQLGKEPPIILPRGQQHGLVIRLCGVDSFVTEASMKTMGIHIFPVFEDPVQIQHFIWKYSENYRRPVYWHVRSGLYGSSFSWSEGFPVNKECFFPGVNIEDHILILEADATNGNDPLMLEGRGSALDLTIDDASQGFRRILDQYESKGLIAGNDFRTLRVYLGNSTEIFTTGGGHYYTLRHRIKYAKEVDVLLDSRAPVLQKILDWCDSVCDNHDRKIFFQTSSRKYFINVKELLKEYGYEVIDPLDLRMLGKMRQLQQKEQEDDEDKYEPSLSSLMSVLLDDEEGDHGTFLKEYIASLPKKPKQQQQEEEQETSYCKHEMLRTVARMSKLPRLIHFENTSQTVNAVEALIAAGEIEHGGKCCALIDRQEGVLALERTLHRTPEFVEQDRHQWNPRNEEDQGQSKTTTTNTTNTSNTSNTSNSSRLQIICSSSIHNDLFRQVRLWARMGFSSSEIQYEVDTQYKDILNKSYNAIQQETITTTEIDREDTDTDDSKKNTNGNHDDDKEKLVESPVPNPQ